MCLCGFQVPDTHLSDQLGMAALGAGRAPWRNPLPNSLINKLEMEILKRIGKDRGMLGGREGRGRKKKTGSRHRKLSSGLIPIVIPFPVGRRRGSTDAPDDHQPTSIRRTFKLLSFLGARLLLLASPCRLGDGDKLSPRLSPAQDTLKSLGSLARELGCWC